MNENTKHTPGPWEVRDASGESICAVAHISTNGHPINTRLYEVCAEQPVTRNFAANARLIAAAPELRCMLQRLLDGVLMLPELPRTLCALDIEQARAAIAKATAE